MISDRFSTKQFLSADIPLMPTQEDTYMKKVIKTAPSITHQNSIVHTINSQTPFRHNALRFQKLTFKELFGLCYLLTVHTKQAHPTIAA